MTKRILVFLISIVAVACAAKLHSASELQVRVSEGVLEGAINAAGDVLSFKGIPYAAPPLCDLRWKVPQAVEAWQGVREVKAFGPRAMQEHVWDDMIFNDEGPSEDCLYLNIWRPAEAKAEKLPVMFWIHGGGFIAGGTSEARQEGSNLAKTDVLVVSVGYRMGVFGFMAHPELTAESPDGASGNYGLLDLVAALHWVKRNISAFGGDPENVTIFGESAGSMAVSALMASPEAKGLFHKAIAQSGAILNPWRKPLSRVEAEQVAVTFAETNFGTSSLADLRSLSGEELLSIYWREAKWQFSVCLDGLLLTKDPATIYENGEQSQVPLIAGWNLDEGGAGGFLRGEATLENYRSRAGEEFGERAEEFLEVYAASTPAEVKRAAADYQGDRFIGYSTWKLVEEHAAAGNAPVYRYRFDHLLPLPVDAPADAEARAAHSWEIEYVFDIIESKNLPWRPSDQEVASMMSGYWSNFAKTGDPNGSGLPLWPSFTEGSTKPVLHIDVSPEVLSDTHRKRYEFLGTIEGE